MNSTAPVKLRDRAQRNARKRGKKKAMIADSAVRALQELGYANTSLRDIAAKSDMSLGMLHYYFEDKMQLIIYCVSAYKSAFTAKVREALADIAGREAMIDAFSGALASTIVEDAANHRLWYDIRAQAMFDPVFRPVVAEIEATLIEVVRVAGAAAGYPEEAFGELDYALIDGAFRYLMQQHLVAATRDREGLAADLRSVLERVF